MSGREYWVLLDIHPEPWRVPPFSVARGRGGKYYARAGQDAQLANYENAVKNQVITNLEAAYPGCLVDNGDFLYKEPTRLTLFIWRNTSESKDSDATNLLKATEDALHGIFYINDKFNHVVQSVIVKQDSETRSGLLFHIEPKRFTRPPSSVEAALSSLGLAF